MAYTPNSYLEYGQWLAQLWRLDVNNYPKGTLIAPDTVVNNTVYSPYVIPAVVSYASAEDTFAEVSSYANMKLRARVTLGLTEFANDTLTLSEKDDVFEPLILGYANDVATATNVRISGRNSGRKTPRRFGLALTRVSATKDNVITYETIVKMNVHFRKGAGQSTSQTVGQNPDPLAYTVIKARSTRSPIGAAFSSTSNLVVDGNSDDEISIQAASPIMFMTYIDDGSATAIVFPYTPDSGEHAGASNIILKNGVDAKASMGTLTGKSWAFTHGSAGDIWTFAIPSIDILNSN